MLIRRVRTPYRTSSARSVLRSVDCGTGVLAVIWYRHITSTVVLVLKNRENASCTVLCIGRHMWTATVPSQHARTVIGTTPLLPFYEIPDFFESVVRKTKTFLECYILAPSVVIYV